MAVQTQCARVGTHVYDRRISEKHYHSHFPTTIVSCTTVIDSACWQRTGCREVFVADTGPFPDDASHTTTGKFPDIRLGANQ